MAQVRVHGFRVRRYAAPRNDRKVSVRMSVAVSVKGVLIEDGSVVLLENERGEWELPGGRPEPGEDAATALVREFAEELGAGSPSGRSSIAGITRCCPAVM